MYWFLLIEWRVEFKEKNYGLWNLLIKYVVRICKFWILVYIFVYEVINVIYENGYLMNIDEMIENKIFFF